MMKKSILWIVFALTFALAAVPAFSQGKGGLGVGGGGQVKVGAGGKADVDTKGVKAGASTDLDDAAKTKVKTPDKDSDKDKGEHRADFVDRIQDNAKVSAKVQALLPSGESMTQAAAGFRNEGQFLAALHVSHNLNIPFDQLKAKMTGSGAMSLGAAIKATRPDMTETQVKAAARVGEKEAKETEKSTS